ncbi:OsmC-like protein [Salinisphaera shabanensis T35B1]|jgi:Ohr subfamily peroxiredoxin|uniref:organic hydroperoxide resistance protein n=1 Tax=Salinisphaera shabanensis TaxID=180542 RepID=UPI00333F8BDA
MAVDKVLYRAQAKATGGRDGRATSADDQIDLKLTTPKALGGAGGDGTNPEQLFAAGYSACFIGAMKVVAGKQNVSLPQDLSVTGEVGIGPSGEAFGIEVTLNISLPDMDKDQADKLVEAAHQVCPYSNATRGNIDVTLNVEV